MSRLAERQGFKIESTLPKPKKNKEKKLKKEVVQHVHIIDDDAPVPWQTRNEPAALDQTEVVLVDDAPIVVGMIDERPSEIREKERFKDPKRWRTTAFETVPEPDSMGPHPKPNGASRQKPNLSDDSDPEVDRRRPRSGRKNDPDLSPPRRKAHQSDSDPSPPRRRRQSNDDPSPPRRKRDDSSPPKKRSIKVENDPSPPRQKRDDSSPPRKRSAKEENDPSPPRRRDPSPPRRKRDDLSPPRKRSIKEENDPSPPRRRDASPPRRKRDDSSSPRRRDSSPPRKRYPRDDDSNSSRHHNKSSSSHRSRDRSSRQESPPSSTDRRRPKEEPSSPSRSRRPKQESPPPPIQPAKSERRRLAEHKEQVAERYTQWGRGIAQVRQQEEAVKDYLEQAEKPLARYRDDTDLDSLLKNREREDDPMLKYLSNKPSDAGGRSSNSNSAPVKPRYKGPDPQKNRFDIWPGYRWDGVDRSNGYEKKLFESIANRHAKAQEAYLWSVEDM